MDWNETRSDPTRRLLTLATQKPRGKVWVKVHWAGHDYRSLLAALTTPSAPSPHTTHR